MPDVVFPDYAFRSSTDTTRAQRSTRERINDEVSVLEFGATTMTGATNAVCRATIQAAFASRQNLYFPQGFYDIDGPILIPDDDAHRTIRGAGPHSDGNPVIFPNGTIIRGQFRDYLWKTLQNYSPATPISSISGMCFKNSYSVPTSGPLITSVDPPGVTFAGNGMGCLYLQMSFLHITNCSFNATSGVGLYFPGICNHLSSFLATGGFDGTQTFCCGVWGSSCTIHSGKVGGCRVGVATMQGPTLLSDMDIELCQFGIMTTNPVSLWDRNSNEIKEPGVQEAGKVLIYGINFESCGSATEGGACMKVGGTLDVSGISFTTARQIGDLDYHLIISKGGGSFKNMSGGGVVLQAGILAEAGTEDLFFTQCHTQVQPGKPAWAVNQVTRTNTAGKNGAHFAACQYSVDLGATNPPYNGATLVQYLPLSNPEMLNDQLVSDCLLPEVDYTTTPPTPNRGKTVITGGGTNITRVICRSIVKLAATANWTTASSTLTVTTNPGSVVAGMIVWKGDTYIGMVSTFVGTTLTLGTNPNTGSGTTAAAAGSSGNILTFACWTVA